MAEDDALDARARSARRRAAREERERALSRFLNGFLAASASALAAVLLLARALGVPLRDLSYRRLNADQRRRFRRSMGVGALGALVVLGARVQAELVSARLSFAEATLKRADHQIDRADDLREALQAMDRQTTRLQKVAITVGVVTGLLGALLGAFAGAWAATLFQR